jgi:hypothetical protein
MNPNQYHDLWVPKRHLELGYDQDPSDFEMRTEPYHRPHRLHGQGVDAMFSGGSTTKPWTANTGGNSPMRLGNRRQDLIAASIIGGMRGFAHPENIDTRWLQMSQDAVAHHVVKHYAENPEYHDTGVTFADQEHKGNRIPLVYQREEHGDRTILSGHHRAAAALAMGKPLRALVVRDNDESVLNEAHRQGYKL